MCRPSKAKTRPGIDVPLLLEAGGRPKAILVDGRIATVDAIRQAAPQYAFTPEFIYAFEKRDWSGLARSLGQSVFISN